MPSIFKKAKAAHIALGKAGEKAARRLLSEKNYDILAQNFKRDSGEIDIVARDGTVLVFAEVKTKRSGSRGRPSENLSEKQKSRISRAAMTYLREIDNPHVIYRFDLIENIFKGGKLLEIKHWQNHFSYHTTKARKQK